MRREVLLTIASGLLMSSTALAQTCATPPSCESLGFTETEADCASGKMLKCPFDLSKVFCDGGGNKGDTGNTGDTGDTGDTGVDPADATPGMIYYSDGTISADVIEGKMPVGVVAYNNGRKRFVIALEETRTTWGGHASDVACLSNTAGEAAKIDADGKSNTQCLLSDTEPHLAASYCDSYAAVTSGKGSSGWYLPATGELYAVHLSYDAVNAGLQKLTKTKISSDSYLSSSEYDSTNVWTVKPSDGFMFDHASKYTPLPVRCVLEF